MFWDWWLQLYLSTLQARQKWRKQTRDYAIGDLVILCDESKTQFLRYSYAVVTGVTKGSDGHFRSATTRMSDGRVRERDIRKIALIDSLNNKY